MAKKLIRNDLEREMATVDALLARAQSSDALGRISLGKRRQELQDKIQDLDLSSSTIASVALVFEGGPVRGSAGLDADFAGRALQDYQELISKKLITSERGGLAQRGPIPERQLARMNVTEVVHGSFGFILEEDNADAPGLFGSALVDAVRDVNEILSKTMAVSDNDFEGILREIDFRLFLSLKKFIGDLSRDEAIIKLLEDEREYVFDHESVHRGYERVQAVELKEEEIEVVGELLGLVPVQRRFELLLRDSKEVIKGSVGEGLSADYLERIHGDERVAGREWKARLLRRLVTHTGRRTTAVFTLVDLTEP